jgi:hypothetical protein
VLSCRVWHLPLLFNFILKLSSVCFD